MVPPCTVRSAGNIRPPRRESFLGGAGGLLAALEEVEDEDQNNSSQPLIENLYLLHLEKANNEDQVDNNETSLVFGSAGELLKALDQIVDENQVDNIDLLMEDAYLTHPGTVDNDNQINDNDPLTKGSCQLRPTPRKSAGEPRSAGKPRPAYRDSVFGAAWGNVESLNTAAEATIRREEQQLEQSPSVATTLVASTTSESQNEKQSLESTSTEKPRPGGLFSNLRLLPSKSFSSLKSKLLSSEPRTPQSANFHGSDNGCAEHVSPRILSPPRRNAVRLRVSANDVAAKSRSTLTPLPRTTRKLMKVQPATRRENSNASPPLPATSAHPVESESEVTGTTLGTFPALPPPPLTPLPILPQLGDIPASEDADTFVIPYWNSPLPAVASSTVKGSVRDPLSSSSSRTPNRPTALLSNPRNVTPFEEFDRVQIRGSLHEMTTPSMKRRHQKQCEAHERFVPQMNFRLSNQETPYPPWPIPSSGYQCMTQTSPLADNHGSKNHLPQPGQAETRSIDDNVLVPPPLSINKERSEARPEQEVAEQKRFEDVGHSEIIAKFPRPPTATQNTPKLAQFEEDDSNPVSATYTTQPSERVLDKQPVYWGVAVEEFPTDKNFNPPAAASTLSEIRYSLSSYGEFDDSHYFNPPSSPPAANGGHVRDHSTLSSRIDECCLSIGCLDHKLKEQAAKPKRAGTYSLERLLAAAESREGYDPNTSNIYRIGSDRVGLRAPTMVHPAFRRGE